MDTLPVEIVKEILLRVDRPSLYYASQVCNLWRRLSLAQTRIITDYTDFKTACKEGDRLTVIRSKFNRAWLNNSLYNACRGGHKELAELMITKGASNWNYGLGGACQKGHKELAELMITKGASNWIFCLGGACQKGHKELVELMITKGADNWNWGLCSACREGRKELVQLMILKGANKCSCGKSMSEH